MARRPIRKRQCLQAAEAAGGAGVSAPSFLCRRPLIIECGARDDDGVAESSRGNMFVPIWKDMEVRMAMCYNHAVDERSKKTNRYFSI